MMRKEDNDCGECYNNNHCNRIKCCYLHKKENKTYQCLIGEKQQEYEVII